MHAKMAQQKVQSSQTCSKNQAMDIKIKINKKIKNQIKVQINKKNQ